MYGKRNDIEASVRKSHEALKQMYNKAQDPETSGSKLPFRFHPSWKYWRDVLAVLPANELKVFLHLRMIANWKTGIALFSANKQKLVLKINRETFDHALKTLVQKQYLAKIARQSRCWSYQILKK